MTQKVLRVGTSLAVTIPKGLAEELGFRVGTPVEISGNKKTKAVVYRPLKNERGVSSREKKITALALDFIERYRKDLEALASK